MKSSEIRDIFIEFFEEREHRVVPGSSLVPNDPTLLLTNAGMVQFKPYFLGDERPPFPRATSVQKCLRTTDIESVGHTARHNTFFEMLGNFSFGDYYKESAIPWAWELLTGGFAIDPGTLWISVFEGDDEAERIWKSTPGVSPERVILLGADDNFWDMGATGPCGPCSEILYDRGEDFACGPGCGPWCDCDRFSELWNLVFMQYNREADGTLAPLPKKNIDTGMGLERVAAIKQGVATIFETDLIMPVVEGITGLSGVKLGDSPGTDVSMKVVADHSRAAAFLISDGVIPSNEGRGYILRRLLRRAVRHGRLLGIGERFIDGLAGVVVEMLGDVYPDLKEHDRLITGVIRAEEERFGRTLEQGLDLLKGVMEELSGEGKETIEGKRVFYLHDTLGFPLELTEEIASDAGMGIDRDAFNALMEEQRERGRFSREGEWEGGCAAFADICRDRGATVFKGYESASCNAEVVAIVVDTEPVEKAEGSLEVEVVLERTPFYAESGGQVGDRGTISGPGGSVRVEDTYYGAPDLVVQKGHLKGSLAVGDEVEAVVDADRRLDISRNHSATHLLHWALRDVLGTHARQSGSLVTPERLRFDFTHFKPLTIEELDRIESRANEKVLDNVPVSTVVASREEARAAGAIALFGEKYGEEVRVVEIGDFSKEFCGGIHVDYSGRIGPIRIISETGIGAGLRRIEATSGRETLRRYRRAEHLLARTAELLKVKEAEVPRRVGEVLARQKELAHAAALRKSLDVAEEARGITERARESTTTGLPRLASVCGSEVLLARVDGENSKALRDLADIMMREAGLGVVAIAGESAGRALLVVEVDKELLAKGLNAREIASTGGKALGGGGGGRDDMAVAGGSRVEGIDQSLARVEKHIRDRLEGEA